MTIEGRASAEGTARFAARHAGLDYRAWEGLRFSPLGLGTYLGPATQEADRALVERVRECIEAGVNVFDAAINYRHQRSERALGDALSRELAAGRAQRDEVFLATKGGFLPFDGEVPLDPHGYLFETYLDSGLLAPSEIAQGVHAMSPAFLRDQIRRSRANLQVETIDLYFLHNPESQRADFPPEVVRARLVDAFEALEREVESGRIARYGVATWDGLRVPPEHPTHLSLAELLEGAAIARERVASGAHHLHAIELPYNAAMPQASRLATQSWQGRLVPFLEAAREARLLVFASASLMQGRLARGGGAVAALRQASAQPGVTTALVGMLRKEHAEENFQALSA